MAVEPITESSEGVSLAGVEVPGTNGVKVDSTTASQVTVASVISGCGHFVPEKIVPNEHFASYLDTSDEWIRSRTGIAERRWAEPGVSASELAEPACKQAMDAAGVTAADIDGIVLATVTPDYVFPATACFLQRRLGCTGGFAFDVNAVCSGFLYAMTTADSLLRSGQARHILVVGVDLYSRIIDPNDRGTCVLFGDGAGAVVLSAVDTSKPGQAQSGSVTDLRGVYGSELGADGNFTDILCVPNGTAAQATAESLKAGEHFLRMEGREVFKFAVRKLGEVSSSLLSKVGLTASDVNHFASHQANQRILDAMAKQLKVPNEKVLSNVARFGNTSAASIPILLSESVAAGTIKKNDLVLLSAVGGGVTWGAMLIRW